MQKSSGNPRLFSSMADRRGFLGGADENLQSTGSSGMSLSFEHQSPEMLGIVANAAQGSSDSSLQTLDMTILESFLISDLDTDSHQEPTLEIVEQPRQKDLRFRYECEGRSAGSLLGLQSNSDRKSYPAVKIKNYTGQAKIIVSLVTRQEPQQLHPNSLVGKTCQNGVCTMVVDVNPSQVISFQNLGIQCAKKKDIQSALKERRRLGLDPFPQQQVARTSSNTGGGSSSSTDFEMNVVCLCFQAFLANSQQPGQFNRSLPPVVSTPIYDKKGASLTISRVDRNSGTVSGGDEMFILCDKVQREDIEVIFFRDDWEGRAVFGPSDIHRQVAIVCKTPPYKDVDIDNPVTVQFKLRRKSDQECSEPVEFIYKPICLDANRIEAKRRKKSPHFNEYWRGPDQIKQEPMNNQCHEALAAFQQQQQQQSSTGQAGSSGAAVKEALRNKLRPTNEQDHVIRHPPQHDLPQTAANKVPSVSSRFCCNSSTMSFGTVTQQEQVGAAQGATGRGAMGPAGAFGSPTVSVNPESIPPHGAVTVEYINTPIFNSADLSNLSAILTNESFTSLLEAESIDMQAAMAMAHLTSLGTYDPSSLSLNGVLDTNAAAEQAVQDVTLEDITDSVSIPYSVSVDIEHELNPNLESNTNG